MKIKTVYFDMDGVLADLDAAIYQYAVESHGVTAPLSELREEAESVHTYYVLRRKELGMYESFASLAPNRLDEMRTVMRQLHAEGIVVEILTSYGLRDAIEMGSEVHRGKSDFMREHYGDLFEDGTITRFNGVSKGSQKQFYATRESILIDDWSRNINEWRATGAPAVHYHMGRHDEGIDELLQLVGLKDEPWG